MNIKDFLDGSGVSGNEEDYARLFNKKGDFGRGGDFDKKNRNPFSVFESGGGGGGSQEGDNRANENAYEILGVPASANFQTIQRAYHQLAKKYHPDSGDNPDSKKFIQVKNAYETLKKKGGGGAAAGETRTSEQSSVWNDERSRSQLSWRNDGPIDMSKRLPPQNSTLFSSGVFLF